MATIEREGMEGLSFEITCETEKAEKNLGKLTNTLERLKKALSGVDGSHTIDTIKDINTAISGVDDSKLTKLKSTLSKVGSAAQPRLGTLALSPFRAVSVQKPCLS